MGYWFWHAILASHFTANMVVLAFHLVRQSFAHVVDQRGVLGGLDICAKLFGNNAGHVRHFGAVLQHVLAVTGTELQFTQQLQNFFWNADYANFAGSIFAGTEHFFMYILLGFLDNLFDTTGVHATVFQEHR